MVYSIAGSSCFFSRYLPFVDCKGMETNISRLFWPKIVRDKIFAFLLMSSEGSENRKSRLRKAYLADFDKCHYLSSCYV